MNERPEQTPSGLRLHLDVLKQRAAPKAPLRAFSGMHRLHAGSRWLSNRDTAHGRPSWKCQMQALQQRPPGC